MCLFVLFIRKALNEKYEQQNKDCFNFEMKQEEETKDQDNTEFCDRFPGRDIPDITNDFITVYLPSYLDSEEFKEKVSKFKLLKKENVDSIIIKVTCYFCNWL